MIPNETLQTVETIGATQTVGNFHITDATQARILVSLSDKMYTRKELAVVREYSTNAADAHIVVNKPINQRIGLRIRKRHHASPPVSPQRIWH